MAERGDSGLGNHIARPTLHHTLRGADFETVPLHFTDNHQTLRKSFFSETPCLATVLGYGCSVRWSRIDRWLNAVHSQKILRKKLRIADFWK